MIVFNLIKYLTVFVTLLGSIFCQSPQVLANIQISFSNNGTHTSFDLTSTQGGSVVNSWMAVGLNNNPQMVSKF